jgi:hypothetical protein
MKKFISTFLMLAAIAVSIPMFAGSADAQRREYYGDDYYSQDYSTDRPSVYDRHRKAVNVGGGAIAGAIIGGLFGGKKGAAIGAVAGAVGGAVVTKKQRPRNYYRYQY